MDPDAPVSPDDVRLALLRSVEALNQHRVQYALIGGLAVGYRSRPRATEDIDFLLDVPQVVLPRVLEDLARAGFDFDLTTVIRQWIQDHLTRLTYHGVVVDWLKPVVPCYRHVLDHARPEPWHDTTVRVAAAEDLILLKLLADRAQDRADVATLLAANRGELDLDRVRREWATVGDANDPRMQRFEEMVGQFYLPSP